MGDINGTGTAVSGLGGAAGFGETLLPRGDDTVAQVDVSAVFGAGFSIGGATYAGTALYVSTDGVVSFGAGSSGVPADPASIPAPFFAIFSADVDTRLDGETPESGGVWLDVDTANDCVTITWDHVGFYRRNANTTDTFQMQLFDRGGGNFDVVYRYQTISWTSGDLQGGWDGLGGTPAWIGYRLAASGTFTALEPSDNQTTELNLPQTAGNTGVNGLWVFNVGGSSAIDGTSAADTLHGSSGNDTLHGLGGNDILFGSAGADLLDGGPGRDLVDYAAAGTGLLIDLLDGGRNTGLASGDRYAGIEGLRGGMLADTILGAAAGDWLDGRGGGDDLQGRTGNDTLLGGGGPDRLAGGDGADSLDGGDADDRLYGGVGQDRLNGGSGNDSLAGNTGSDVLQGGPGGDRLAGAEGNDSLVGWSGNDLLYGGTGADRLDGGPGADTLTGGPGADRFCGSGAPGTGGDRITDFSNAAGDSLVFSRAGAKRADFGVAIIHVAGAGSASVDEVRVTYLPTNILVWTIVDGADEVAILLQSSMNSFDIL